MVSFDATLLEATTSDTVMAPDTAVAAPPVDAPRGRLAGKTLAQRYDVIDLLGVGGMGEVYRARDRELDEVVALKLLLPGLSAALLERFKNEVKLARRVTHRNVARTFELGEHAGERFLTMEYVEGESVGRLLGRSGRLEAAAALRVAAGVAEALAAAHAAGVVHRDIKPDNVILGRDGRVVVTDFGIARDAADARGEGDLAGTPAYMAPEQARGAAASAASDVYALGVMTFEMMTGTLPFSGATPIDTLVRRTLEPPPDPRARVASLPAGAAAIVLRAMATAPEDRYASAALFAAAIDAEARPSLPPPPIQIEVQELPPHAVRTVLLRRPSATGSAAYLADALFDRVTYHLARTPRLRLLARATAEGGGDDDAEVPSRAARAVGADVVITAAVTGDEGAAGGEVHARALEVATNRVVWSTSLRISATRIPRVAASMADAIVLAADTGQELFADDEVGDDAVTADIVLRARHLYHSALSDSLQRSLDLYRSALARSPDDPEVLSGFAMTLTRLAFFAHEAPASLEDAQVACARALAVAPDAHETQLAAGHLALHGGRPVEAAERFRRALALAPRSPDAHEWVGSLLLEAGLVRDATRRYATAMQIDPRFSFLRWGLARAHLLDGDTATGEAMLAEILGPAGTWRGRWAGHIRIAAWKRDPALLVRMREQMRLAPAAEHFDLPFVEAMLAIFVEGRWEAEKPAIFRVAMRPFASTRRSAFYAQVAAEAAAWAGDIDACVALLERTDELGLVDLHWMMKCPLLDGMRGEAGFGRVLESVSARVDAVLGALYRG